MKFIKCLFALWETLEIAGHSLPSSTSIQCDGYMEGIIFLLNMGTI